MCPGAIEMLTSRHRAGVAEDMGTVHCRAASLPHHWGMQGEGSL